MSVNANAQSPAGLGLQVLGTDVTSENSNDVLGDGTVSYDDATNTLTLNNAKLIPNEMMDVIRSERDLNIKLIGTNTIKNTEFSGNGILFPYVCNAVISGTGTLNITTKDNGYNGNGDLTIIGGCTVNIESVSNYGLTLAGGKLTVRNSTLKASGSLCATNSINHLYLFSSGFEESGYLLHPDQKCVTDGSFSPVKSFTIIPKNNYGFSVLGTEVNGTNCNNILGDGTAWFDPSTKTLHFRDLQILAEEGSNVPVLVAYDSQYYDTEINVELHGESNVVISDNSAFISENIPLTIKGFGSMIINTTGNFPAITTSSCTIKDCNLEIYAIEQGINVTEPLTINNASLEIYISKINVEAAYALYGTTEVNILGSTKLMTQGAFLANLGCGPGYYKEGQGMAKQLEFSRIADKAGDLNGDGKVDINDITILIDIVKNN